MAIMCSRKIRKVLFGMVFFLAAVMLSGCGEGDDGARGPQGPEGPAGSETVDLSTMTEEEQAELGTVSVATDSISVTIESPPVVTFALEDEQGRPVQGLAEIMGNDRDTGRIIRFTLVKLVPPSNGDSGRWYSYVKDSGGTPDYDSQYGGGTLVANDDNTYTYTFFTDVGSDPEYDPTATHRLAGQLGGGPTNFDPSNFVYDFVPNGSSVTNNRNIVMTGSCNECHDPLNFHGRRRRVGYCVTCHNPGMAEGEGSMAFMTHKLHAAGTFDVLDEGVSYAEVTYPQDLRNCRKCHNSNDAQTPQADSWQTVQNEKQCFSACHGVPQSVEDATGTFHDDVTGDCRSCHGVIAQSLNVDEIHTTPNATANNPDLLEGQREIEYQIDSAEITGGGDSLEITFRILSDGTALDLSSPASVPADLSDTPVFLFAYAEPQDGITSPADFNNLASGEGAGQPLEQDLEGLIDGTDGSVTCTNGTCTATLTNPFPDPSTRRTVGLQGYYEQDLDGDGSADVSLHTRSALAAVTSDTPRRPIVDSAECASCHEILEAHGGNRVFTAEGGVDICTMCHTPNLTSSGRTLDEYLDDPEAEASNNLKDMIHGIHAADFRTTDYVFVRNNPYGNNLFDWSEVTFPGDTSNCAKCHMGMTYLPEEIPAAAFWTTNRITQAEDGMDATTTDVETARANVPNPNDWVITPVSAACYACHDSTSMVAHMEQFGGAIDLDRGDVSTTETCGICHNTGNIADVEVAHDLED